MVEKIVRQDSGYGERCITGEGLVDPGCEEGEAGVGGGEKVWVCGKEVQREDRAGAVACERDVGDV